MKRNRPQRVMAISSGGGHWVELLRLVPALQGCLVHYVTVERGYARDIESGTFHVINDATRWNKIAMGVMLLRVLWLIVRIRPDIIITTGAAPGFAAIRVGKWFKARTIWLDSIANADELSMSGRLAGRYADLWLTQWAHLATTDGPEYAGAVL